MRQRFRHTTYVVQLSPSRETTRPLDVLDAYRRESLVARRSDAIADLNTSELRWFAPGRPPRVVMDWFSKGGVAGTPEKRRDVYHVNGLSDVGVKRRSGRSLEVKVRMAVGSVVTVVGLTPTARAPIDMMHGDASSDRPSNRRLGCRRFWIGAGMTIDRVDASDLT